ncbi:glycosyltransferase family 87 protein [Nocardioides baekrokdamisoli]|nr:glycosyltransferase family 87 protein [Nocardioides baekrokdamisoli]
MRLVRAALIIGAVTTGFSIWLIGHPSADFAVYLGATHRWVHGGDPYASLITSPQITPPGMLFTYTPFALIALAPLTVLSWQAVTVIWTLVTVAILYVLVERLTPDVPRRALVVLGVFALLMGDHVVNYNVTCEQINIPLMGLVLFDMMRSDDSPSARWLPRGVMVGAATAIKLTPGLFIAYFILSRQWRLALWSALSAAGVTLASWVLMPHLSSEYWFHLSDLQNRVVTGAGSLANSSNGSIQGMFDAGWPGAPPMLVKGITVLVALAALATAVYVHRRGRSLEAALIIGMAAPALSPVGWVHHWAFVAPAIVVALFHVRWTRVTATLGVLLYAAQEFVPKLGDRLSEHAPWLTPVGLVVREAPGLTALFLIVLFVMNARSAATGRPMKQGYTEVYSTS